MRRSRTTIRCPECGSEFYHVRPQHRHNARTNLIKHMIKEHDMTRDEAEHVLAEHGIFRLGTPIDQAIAEYEEQRERGVAL